MFTYILSGTVTALKDCWIVGDLFISQIFYALPAKNSERKLKDKSPLYIYERFNIKCYSTNLLNTNIDDAPARLVNSLVNGLNANTYLPCIVIIIPDWDIAKFFADQEIATNKVLTKSTKWMVKAMSRSVQKRKDDLKRLHPGAITSTEPKMIWVKMVDRPGVIDKALAARHKFNRAIENALVDKPYHHIIDVIEKMNEAKYYFQQEKKMNEDGMNRFWIEVTANIKEFEEDGLKLLPKKNIPRKQNKHQGYNSKSHHQRKYKHYY